MIDPRTECWNWTARMSHGYGQFSIGATGKRYQAHRYVYEQLVGPIPEGVELDHKCRNRACVNPKHMELVSHKVNCRRGDMGLHNFVKTHCKNSHEFTPENTMIRKGPQGQEWRQCRECGRAAMRDYMTRRRRAAGIQPRKLKD